MPRGGDQWGSPSQVSRAADYFRRWVARWPNVHALAAASLEEVNEMWAGLGYYRR
jgi:A/G-specific adenine glycosylase